MHDKNPYLRHQPDFAALARRHPTLRPHVKGRSIDFRDPEALRILSQVLLLNDFGLRVAIPKGHLIPTVPSRLDYVCWVREDLLAATDGPVAGIDIGTGTTCVYPLLACATNRDWTMVGTDVDEAALACARDNVRANGLDGRIALFHTPDPLAIVRPVLEAHRGRFFAFVMCNPPFYESETDRVAKKTAAMSANECVPSEAVCLQGERGFVARMYRESTHFPSAVRWYTSLLGKRHSLVALRDMLAKETAVKALRWTRFIQGRTCRWAIAWTFLPSPSPPSQPQSRRSRLADNRHCHPPSSGCPAGRAAADPQSRHWPRRDGQRPLSAPDQPEHLVSTCQTCRTHRT